MRRSGAAGELLLHDEPDPSGLCGSDRHWCSTRTARPGPHSKMVLPGGTPRFITYCYPHSRRSDGHDDPGLQACRGRLSRSGVVRAARPRPRSQGRQRPARPDPTRRRSGRSTTISSTPAPTSSRPTRSTPPASRRPTTGSKVASARSILRRPGSRGSVPMHGPRRHPTSLDSSLAPSARPTAPRPCRPMSTIPASATSVTTTSLRPTPKRSMAWSKAAWICCWWRPFSTR